MSKPWERYQSQSNARPYSFNYTLPEEEQKPEETGFLGEVGDSVNSVARGGLGAVKAVTDLFGANNWASQGLQSGIEGLGSLQSDQQRLQREEHARRMQEAEATGSTWEEIKAAGRNFLDDPLDYSLEGLGSLVVPFGAGKAARLAKLGSAGTTATVGGVGAGMGVGAVKGSQYEAVYRAEMTKHGDPVVADQVAAEAQSYSRDNAVDLLAGGALGLAAGLGPAESIAAGRLIPSLTGKGWAKRGLLGSVYETVPEATQGGQERYAANSALNRYGYEVDPWRGVAGQATQEGLMAGPMGGAMSIASGYQPTQAEQEAAIAKAAEDQRLAADAARQAQQADEEAQRVADEQARVTDLRMQYQPEFASKKDFIKQRTDAILADEMSGNRFREQYDAHRREALGEGREPDTEEAFKKKLAKQIATDNREQFEAEWINALDRFAQIQEERVGLESKVASSYANSSRVANDNDELMQLAWEEGADLEARRERLPYNLGTFPQAPQGLSRTPTDIHQEAINAGVPISGYEQQNIHAAELPNTGFVRQPEVTGRAKNTEQGSLTRQLGGYGGVGTMPGVGASSAGTPTGPLGTKATPKQARTVVNDGVKSGVVPKERKNELIQLSQANPDAAVAAVEELQKQDEATNVAPPEAGTKVAPVEETPKVFDNVPEFTDWALGQTGATPQLAEAYKRNKATGEFEGMEPASYDALSALFGTNPKTGKPYTAAGIGKWINSLDAKVKALADTHLRVPVEEQVTNDLTPGEAVLGETVDNVTDREARNGESMDQTGDERYKAEQWEIGDFNASSGETRTAMAKKMWDRLLTHVEGKGVFMTTPDGSLVPAIEFDAMPDELATQFSDRVSDITFSRSKNDGAVEEDEAGLEDNRTKKAQITQLALDISNAAKEMPEAVAEKKAELDKKARAGKKQVRTVKKLEEKDTYPEDVGVLEQELNAFAKGESIGYTLRGVLKGRNGPALMQRARIAFGLPRSAVTAEDIIDAISAKLAAAEAEATKQYFASREKFGKLWDSLPGKYSWSDLTEIERSEFVDAASAAKNPDAIAVYLKEDIENARESTSATGEYAQGATGRSGTDVPKANAGSTTAGQGGSQGGKTPVVQTKRKRTIVKPEDGTTTAERRSETEAAEGLIIEGEFYEVKDGVPLLENKIDNALTPEERSLVTSDPQLGNGNYEAGRKKLAQYVADSMMGKSIAHLKKAVRDLIQKLQNGAMAMFVAFNFNTGVPVSTVSIDMFRVDRAYAADINMDGAAISAEAKKVAQHALNRGNGKPFVVVDKPNAMLYAFDKDGNLLGKTPVLLGKSSGDKADLTKGVDQMTDADKVTPSGTYTGRQVADPEYGTRVQLDETLVPGAGVIAIHRVYLGTPSEQRQQRLDTQTNADNRVSYGCINVPSAFYDGIMAGNFVGQSQIYVTPETRSAKAEFGLEDDKVVKTTGKTGTVQGDSRTVVGKEEGRESKAQFSKASTDAVTSKSLLDLSQRLHDAANSIDVLAEGQQRQNKLHSLGRVAKRHAESLRELEVGLDSAKTEEKRSRLREYIDERREWALEELQEVDTLLAQFSKSAPAQGTTRQAIDAVVRELTGKHNNWRVHIFQNEAEAVAARILSASEADGRTQAFVMPDAKGVKHAYFILDNIAPGKERAVFLHEVGSHIGLENVLNKETFDRLVGQIRKWAAGENSDYTVGNGKFTLQDLAIEAMSKAQQSTKTGGNKDLETVAYFLEAAVGNAGVDPTAMQYKNEFERWVRTIWAAFKTALRKLRIQNIDKLTAQDVVDLAYGAARLELATNWHGTAAQFRKFNHGFMGSGEGAQAFGWGTYIAQRFGIGKGYWEADVKRKATAENVPDEVVSAAASMEYGGTAATRQMLVTSLRVAGEQGVSYAMTRYWDDLTGSDRTTVRKWLNDGFSGEGSLMRVDTTVQEDEMLDWDKPLSEQSEKVKTALWDLAKRAVIDNDETAHTPAFPNWDNATGRDYYEQLEGRVGSDKAASEYLDSIGIKGIKFLDANSRNATTVLVDKAGNKVAFPGGQYGFDAWHFTNGFATLQEALVEAERQGVKGIATSIRQSIKKGYTLRPSDKTNNLVIFNDKNLIVVGNHKGANTNPGAIQFSKSAPTQTQDALKRKLEYLPASLQTPALSMATTIQDTMKRGLYGAAFGHDLVDLVKKHLPMADKYFALMTERETTENKYAAEIDDIMIKAYGVKDKDALEQFLKKSTRSGKWGFMPSWAKDAKVDAGMEAQFNALSGDAQAVAKAIFEKGHTFRNELRNTLKAAIDAEFADLDKANLSKEDIRKIEKRKLKQMRMFDKQMGEITGPYAPLSRFGNFIAVAKSATYMAAEKAGDKAKIEELESDPEHKAVFFADSLGEARVIAEEMQSRGFQTDYFAKEFYQQGTSEAPWMAIQRLQTLVKEHFGDEKDANKNVARINSMLKDLYLSTAAEASSKRHELRRRNIEGASDDMLRAFATKGRADAHFIAQLKNHGKINAALSEMRSHVAEKDQKADARRTLNEIMARHSMGMEYKPTPLQDKTMAFTSFWMLLTNPRYYAMNAMQTYMISVPYMAGRFGYGRTAKEVNRAYMELSKGFGGVKGFKNGAFDIDALPISDGDKKFLHDLKNLGKLDIGIQMDLGTWEAGDSKAAQAIAKTAHFTRTLARQVEVVNRVSAGLAAYRMAAAEGRANPTQYAVDVVNRTHGDYTRLAAPRWVNMMPKFMTQFMKYKLIQWSLMARLGATALKGADKDERAAAAKAFGWMMGQSAVVTGAMATPPAYILMALINAIAGDDDDEDPRSLEERARAYIGDPVMADMLLRGAPAAMGADMSKYVGWEGVVNPMPFVAEDPMSRRGYADSVLGVMGPFVGGLVPKFLDGISLMGDGEYHKGLEKMMPTLGANAMKALREANDGVTLRNGDVLLKPEEINFFDGFMQTLGLPTTKTTDAQRNLRWGKDREQHFEDTTRRLRNEYAQAYRDKDSAKLAEVRADWETMRNAQRRLGLKPSSLSSLLKSPQAQAKREQELEELTEDPALVDE